MRRDEPTPDAEDPPPRVLGVLEDERVRAMVTIEAGRSRLRIEGALDGETAPVVKELIDALDRWHGQRSRLDRGRGRPVDPHLVIDACGAVPCDSAGWRLLAEQRDRWRRTRGPCELQLDPGPEAR
jgi:anti-anti-sigma regulatory factor